MRAAITASCPTRIGPRKLTSSMDAVTASVRLCRYSTMAAARSIQCSTRPPRTFPMVLASFGRTSSTISTWVSRGLLPRRSLEGGVDILQDLVRLGMRALLRELDRFLELALDALDRRQLVRLVDHPALHENLLEPRNRVALLPVLQLLLRAVVRGIDLGVAVPPVRLHLDQGRTVPFAGAADRLLGGLVGREEIVPVDRDSGESVSLRALGDVLHGHPQRGGHRFGPEIVLHHEHAVQPMDARQVQGLVPHAVRRGAFAHEADRHVVLLLDLVCERAAGRDHGLGGDGRGGGDDPERLPSVVTRVRLAAIRAVLAREELREDVLERHSLGDGRPHLAVLDSDRVLGPESVAGTHNRGLLPDGAEVGAVEATLLEQPAASLVRDSYQVQIVVEAFQLMVRNRHRSS